jgi:hypothetical protein
MIPVAVYLSKNNYNVTLIIPENFTYMEKLKNTAIIPFEIPGMT